MGALYFTHMNQGLITTLPYVLSVYMVRDFLAAKDPSTTPSEEHVGTLTGLLGACFCAAQLLTSYPLGLLSDRIGRRPIIIVGNISCVLGSLAFGLSGSYAQAVVARIGAGLANAIIGAEKAIIGDVLTPKEQAKAMAYISLMWGIGTMIGPTMGGMLAMPCGPSGLLKTKYSNDEESSLTGRGLCSAGSLLQRRPYFLPCLVAALISAIATLLTIFFLQESLTTLKERRNTKGGYMPVGGHDQHGDSGDEEEERRNLTGEVELTNIEQGEGMAELHDRRKLHNHSTQGRMSPCTNTICTIEEDQLRIEDSAKALDGGESHNNPSPSPPSRLLEIEELPWHKQRNVILCLAGYALIAFCYILLDELIPLFASADIKLGGLGFPSSRLALPMAFGGAVLVAWSMFMFPRLHTRFGGIWCCNVGLYLTAPMALVIPSSSFPWAPSSFTMWVAMGLKAIAGTMSFTSSIIMVNSVAPKGSLGAVNGVGQTLASAVRAAGPALGGILWGSSLVLFKSMGTDPWGHQFLPFAFGAVVALCTLWVYKRVELPLEVEVVEKGGDRGEAA